MWFTKICCCCFSLNRKHGKIKIENEYQNVEKAFGEDGSRYVQWAAEMAVGLKTGVPWLMCKQTDAPDPLVSPIQPNFFIFTNLALVRK